MSSILINYWFAFYLSIFSANPLPDGFVYLTDICEDIVIDLRYLSTNNFVGTPIDGYESEKCIISMNAAKAVLNVQNDLKALGYGLKVFDAYRPQQAVNHFVRWAKDLDDTTMKEKYYPEVAKNQLFNQGYIASKSGHSRGSTIDLTIIHMTGPLKGKELDMGSPWDFFGPISWPASDKVSAKQKENRMLLQKLMIKHGFRPYSAEWWHFTLNNEPFPKTYFDFPVK